MTEEWQPPLVSTSVRLDDIVQSSSQEDVEKEDDLIPLKPAAGDAPIFSVPGPAAPSAFEPARNTEIGDDGFVTPPPLPARSRPEPDSSSDSVAVAATGSVKTRPESIDESFLSPSVAPECMMQTSAVVDLIYWRDIKKTGLVFGASLFLLLSMTIFSIVSVIAYLALALLSVTISFRIYRGILQAVQKSDDGHPFKACLETDVAVSNELVHKYSDTGLGHINRVITELRRLFLVEDLVDSLKFSVLMWLLTYVGALFNGLTLLIMALVAVFSIPVVYERHQAQIDHYIGIVSKQIRDVTAKIQTKVPGLKRKTE